MRKGTKTVEEGDAQTTRCQTRILNSLSNARGMRYATFKYWGEERAV